MSLKDKVTFAKKIVEQAKKELNKEKEEKYKIRAKSILEEIQEAQRTVNLLEKQLNNFIREMDLEN